MIWALLHRSSDWFSLGFSPVSQLSGKCDYGAMIRTGIPVRDTARTPPPDTSRMRGLLRRDFWRLGAPISSCPPRISIARLAMEWELRRRMALDWVGNGGARICAGDSNRPATDAEMDRVYTNSPHVSDVWGAMMPGNPGYTHNGVANMNARRGAQGRIGRILCANEVRAIARSVEPVGTKPMRKIYRGFPGRSKACQVRPIDHFGVVDDFSTNEAAPAGRGPPPPGFGPVRSRKDRRHAF